MPTIRQARGTSFSMTVELPPNPSPTTVWQRLSLRSVHAAVAGLLCLLFVVGCGGREGGSVAAGRASDRIVFVSERGGNPEVYVMDSGGSDVHRLTRNRSDDFFPSWSPDGRRSRGLVPRNRLTVRST